MVCTALEAFNLFVHFILIHAKMKDYKTDFFVKYIEKGYSFSNHVFNFFRLKGEISPTEGHATFFNFLTGLHFAFAEEFLIFALVFTASISSTRGSSLHSPPVPDFTLSSSSLMMPTFCCSPLWVSRLNFFFFTYSKTFSESSALSSLIWLGFWSWTSEFSFFSCWRCFKSAENRTECAHPVKREHEYNLH